MPLSMTRPFKHPDSGVYWFRKVVPADLRALVGKREEKQSLQTKDPALARRRHAEALAEVEARWANLRQGQRSLSESDAHVVAASWYEHWVGAHRANPSQQPWPTSLADRMWLPLPPLKHKADGSIDISALDPNVTIVRDMENFCREKADESLSKQGFVVDQASQLKLAKAIGYALQRAGQTLAEYAKGNYGFNANAAASPKGDNDGRKPQPFNRLIEGWKAERNPRRKTVDEWTRAFNQFEKFLGHDDACRVTAEDVISWKDQMVREGLRPKTIEDAKLAAVRTIFEWGKKNRRLQTNPAEDVSIKVKASKTGSKRGFTDEEAAIILKAAKSERDPVRRWVPWLGAYTGARISELCQIRREDVLQIDGIWSVKIVPEAGDLKTASSERVIPIHPAVIESGFIKFVQKVKSGPLFADLSPDTYGKRGGNGTKVIGRWVRSMGLTDQRLSPSHAWRHRIKTLGRRYGLAKDMLDAITGHARKSEGDKYGEYPVEALYRELCKIPPIPV